MNSLVTTALSALVSIGIGFAPATPVSLPAHTPDEILQHVAVPESLAVDTQDAEIAEALTAARSYVDLSTQAWDAQSEEAYWTQQSVETAEKVQISEAKATKADADADAAQEKADESRAEAMKWYRAMQRGEVDTLDPTLSALLMGPENAADSARAYGQVERISEQRQAELEQAVLDAEAAEEARKQAQDERDAAKRLADEAQTYLQTAKTTSDQADQLAADATAQWTNVWRSLDPAKDASSLPTGTKVLNIALIEAWNAKLDAIAATSIPVPGMAELVSTDVYPQGVTQVDAIKAQDITGVGQVGDTVVPSRESIARTSQALAALGQPYQVDGDGTNGWSCSAFVANAVGAPGANLNDVFTGTGRQNADIADTVSGDIVFFAEPQAGIHQGGVFVLGGFVVNASAASGRVSTDTMSIDALASVRPGTQAAQNAPAPVKVPGSADWQCGGIAGAEVTSTKGWVVPVPEDVTTMGAKFAAKEARFGEGGNPGLEFIAPANQVVVADFDGIITDVNEDPAWGKYVVITHAEGLKTRYSGLSAVSVALGAPVVGGDAVGIVGNTGSASKPEQAAVLVTITANNENIDPQTVFFPESSGRYPNGQIPAEALCPVVGGGLLRCDAARAYSIMAEAYQRETGNTLVATDTYRSFEGQVQCRANKGDMCAVPGTSNHGWGLAVDFGGGIETFDTPAHNWMVANAAKYGWYHPEWAQKTGSKPEAWHWEYITAK